MPNSPPVLSVVFRCGHSGTIPNPYPDRPDAALLVRQACGIVDCQNCQNPAVELRATKSVMLNNFNVALWQRARIGAIKQNVSVSHLVEQALSEYLERNP